jgi:hypothetical protein
MNFVKALQFLLENKSGNVSFKRFGPDNHRIEWGSRSGQGPTLEGAMTNLMADIVSELDSELGSANERAKDALKRYEAARDAFGEGGPQ